MLGARPSWVHSGSRGRSALRRRQLRGGLQRPRPRRPADPHPPRRSWVFSDAL